MIAPLPLKRPVISDHKQAQSNGDLGRLLADAELLESFRSVRRFLDLPKPSASAVVIASTATLYDEGASSLALGLAASLAYDQLGRVLLVDCDFNRPSLHDRLGLEPNPGLSEILARAVGQRDAIRGTLLPLLAVLPSGERRRTGMSAAEAVIRWVVELKVNFAVDYLILDLPPVNVDLGTRLLAKAADRTVLTVRGGATPREELRLALLHLDGSAVSVIVHGAKRRMPRWLERIAGARG